MCFKRRILNNGMVIPTVYQVSGYLDNDDVITYWGVMYFDLVYTFP